MDTDFKLRPWTMDDLASLVKYANNEKIARNMTDQFPYPYTEDAGRVFLGFATKGDPPNILCIEVNGEAAGGIGIHPQSDIQRRNAELGYWLAEKYWDRGITTRAVRQMVKYAFDNFSVDRLYARPFGRNIASQRVLEKVGFILEGRFKETLIKNGELEDELVYAMRRGEV